MATKLKGLEVGKVDFVDEGANQRADIKLLKGKNKAEETSDPERCRNQPRHLMNRSTL